MSIPIKHHFLPEFYQRGWTGADEKVTVFTRPRDRLIAQRNFPSQTGYEKELYAVESRTDPAARQALETEVMSPVDNGAARFLDHIRNRIGEEANPDDGDAWATFIISLLHRSPFMVQKLKESLNAMEGTVLKDVRDAVEKLRGDEVAQAVEDAALGENPRRLPEAFAKLLPMLINNERTRDALRSMEWAVTTLADGAHSLLTSDNPLLMSNGIAYQNSFIILPVGPRSLFIGAHRRDVIEAFSAQGARALSLAMNDAVVRQARHFVISADDRQRKFVDNRLLRGKQPDNDFGGFSWECPIDLPKGPPLC
jgi:hypothetical protein